MPKTPIPSILRHRARRMRHEMTEAELRFWNAVRAHRLMGLGFRRQMVVAGYIVDFACPARRLIVEIDGSQHGLESHMARDRQRTDMLEAAGWTLIRASDRKSDAGCRSDALGSGTTMCCTISMACAAICCHVLAVIAERERGLGS